MNEKSSYLIQNHRLYFVQDGENRDIGGAIYIDRYVTNVDTGEVSVHVSFYDNGSKVTKVLTRDEITPQKIVGLTKYGADCWKEVSDLYADHLREQITQMERNFEHSDVGWGEYQGKEFFKHHQAVGLPSTYKGDRYNLNPKGSHEVWMEMVKKEVLGNQWLECALACGFTAPLVKIIKEEANMDSLFINFYGISSTGKTLATRLAVSPFGLPDTRKNGLLLTWYGTDQGILHHLRGNFGIPMVIDDTSMQETDKDFTQFIYLIAGGQEKLAMTSHGTKRERSEWITTVFSSSEVSILQNTDKRGGIRVRFFEISEKLTKSAENAEEIEKVVLKNYGHAGPLFINYLFGMEHEEITDRWYKIKQQLVKKMGNDQFTHRIAGKLAVIQLAGELANEALDLGLDIEKLQEGLMYLEAKSVQTRNKEEEAYRHIMEYFSRNRSKFFRDASELVNKKVIVGKYLQKGGKISEIRIPKEEFEKILKYGKFDPDSTVNKWKEKGWLVHDNGKNTLTRVFQPGMPRMAMYAFKVLDISDVELNQTEQFEEKKLETLAKEMEHKENEHNYSLQQAEEYQEKTRLQKQKKKPKKRGKYSLSKVSNTQEIATIDEF
ncbi:DUF927 domain-containing protein [Cytobacillus firmus]|uniref:DUF927 domain-containing protein n=1 Tax=Cytobacillus firmus DS1 TaxID=1307436 RepID=W7L9W4_CYTFI|nr:DUF927 domain-containing protein [Cytobacillus firmus]EWG12027.1 hypothetical protein PBF_04508 [Cytobacillus firmus DS1]